MGAFDGARTHDINLTSQTCNTLRHASPLVTSQRDMGDYRQSLYIWFQINKILIVSIKGLTFPESVSPTELPYLNLQLVVVLVTL